MSKKERRNKMLTYVSTLLKKANVPEPIRENAFAFFIGSWIIYFEGVLMLYCGSIIGLFVALAAIPTTVMYPVKCQLNISCILDPIEDIDEKDHPFLHPYEIRKLVKELPVYYELANENNIKLRKFYK